MPQTVKQFLRKIPCHLRNIGLLHLITGMEKTIHQGAVIRDEQEPLRVVVQTPHGIDALLHLRQKLQDRAPSALVTRRGQVPLGLVEQEIHMPLRPADAPAIHADSLPVRIALPAQFCHGLALHRNPAFQYDLFCRPAGSDPRPADDFLQTLFHISQII